MGLIDGLHNVPERFKPCCSSLAPLPTNNNNNNIVFLQEIHAYSACETLWEKEWRGDILWNHGTTRSRGVAIAFKCGLQYHVNNIKTDDQGRLLLNDINIEDRNFCLANVYGTNVDNPTFYSNLFNQLQIFSTSDIILGGDLI